MNPCNLIKIPESNFVYLAELILKFIGRGKRPGIHNILMEKN